MITGINQDVSYKGRVYHVQTEDRGLSNPIIETLIYVKGEILSSHRTQYGELLKNNYDEKRIAKILEQQHRRIVVDIKLGKFDSEPGPKTLGEGIVSTKSLDQVIIDYLSANSEKGEKELEIEVLEQTEFYFGEPSAVKILVALGSNPIQNAQVSVKIRFAGGEEIQLSQGKTDVNGVSLCRFSIPLSSASALIVIDVASQIGSKQIRSLARKKP